MGCSGGWRRGAKASRMSDAARDRVRPDVQLGSRAIRRRPGTSVASGTRDPSAGHQRDAVAGRRQAARQIDDDALGAAVVPRPAADPSEEGDVHGGYQSIPPRIFLRRMTLRVLQVLHQGGGAGSVTSTLHLSLGLARAGVAVRFVCPPGSEVEALARAGGLEVIPLSLEPRAGRAMPPRSSALLERHPVDLVNSQSARDRRGADLARARGAASRAAGADPPTDAAHVRARELAGRPRGGAGGRRQRRRRRTRCGGKARRRASWPSSPTGS